MNSLYRYSCMIPFHLADPAGIVFFGHAFTLFHQAFEHFVVDQLKCSWSFWFQNSEWIVPIKHAESQYLHPLFAGRECYVELSVNTSTKSSFTILSSIQQRELCCSLKTVHVFCNRKNHQKMQIPHEISSNLLTCVR